MPDTLFIKPLPLSVEQLETLLSRLQLLTTFIYLDSANLSSGDEGFSVCVWHPKTLVTTKGQHSTIRHYMDNEAGILTESTSTADPLALVQQALENLPVKDDQRLPFIGGALGYWGYELGGAFEKLPNPKSDQIELPDMVVGIYDSGIVIDHATNKISFFSQSPSAQCRFNWLEHQLETLETDSNLTDNDNDNSNTSLNTVPDVGPFKLTSNWSSNMTFSDYAEKFAKVKEYLASGDCYQINLAQRFSADYQGCEWQAYQALRDSNKAPFSSFMRVENGAILSVSPERFLQVKGERVETKPIKGTRPRHNDEVQDKALANELAHAEKDRAENLMIVDLLRNDIAKVSVAGSVKVPKLFAIESYPAVHHLVSTVTSKLKPPYNALDLLRGAFPGGSITGAPKIRAMQIIHELEPHPRSVYCGSIGYIKSNGDMDTNITIRTLVCNKQRVYCWAGGGLVADSNCESEYQETHDKVNKILPILSAL